MPDPAFPILITGAGRNIGAHLGRRLLDDGRAVIAHYRTKTDAVAALAGAGAATVQGELDTVAGIEAVAAAVGETAPELSGIIHNASTFAPTPADPAAAAADFAGYWGVHMLAPYLLTRRLENRLRGAHGKPADIVAITDIYADNPAPQYDIYCASKAGLQNLALALAKRLAPRVKVNVLQPGPISFDGRQDAAEQQRILESTPMVRAGGVEAVYAALRAILDNDYLTGAVIPVDGGRRLGRC